MATKAKRLKAVVKYSVAGYNSTVFKYAKDKEEAETKLRNLLDECGKNPDLVIRESFIEG